MDFDKAILERIEAIVIGASAGGIDALLKLLSGFPRTYRLPIVVVLHVPDDHESMLAEVFAHHAAMPVREARDKESIAGGTLYFAPPGYHLSIEPDRSFSLSCEAPVHFSRPSIDFLMESAAYSYGSALAGIILTGANQDGAAGLAKIAECGGLTVVQNPEEAQTSFMPKAAIMEHAPDLVLRLQEIRHLLLKLGEDDRDG